jgi:SAM-dependent methyltransferase
VVEHNRRVIDQRENDFDRFAAAYNRKNERSPWNAYYERPAVLSLVGDVDGKGVLDAGCGAGAHAAALIERGARVTGIDASTGLLAIAAERLGDAADLHVADLAGVLPFADDTFDVVLVSLVMHYLQDWAPTLREFRRILLPGGLLVISTHHPFADHVLSAAEDYFATYQFDELWDVEDQQVRMRFWHRPLSAMTRAITDAGFRLRSVEEPQPGAALRDLNPQAWSRLSTGPAFVFFTGEAVADGAQ